MTPEDIKALRKDLACTAKELAAALGIEQGTVLAWEKAELFPTKAFVDRMNELRAKGPSAIPRKARGAEPAPLPDGPADLASWARVVGAETDPVPPPVKFATDPATLSTHPAPADFAVADQGGRPRPIDAESVA